MRIESWWNGLFNRIDNDYLSSAHLCHVWKQMTELIEKPLKYLEMESAISFALNFVCCTFYHPINVGIKMFLSFLSNELFFSFDFAFLCLNVYFCRKCLQWTRKAEMGQLKWKEMFEMKRIFLQRILSFSTLKIDWKKKLNRRNFFRSLIDFHRRLERCEEKQFERSLSHFSGLNN